MPESQIPAPGGPEGGRPAKRARLGTQGPREASPEPFADGFKCDRRGVDGSDYEGDDDEPPRGSPAQELERLWGLHQAGAITLREFNALKKATIAELAPVKKEERKVKQEQAPRAPIKRDPAGVRIKKEPGKVAGATEKSIEQRGIEAKPVDKQTMQLFPGSGRAEVGRRQRGIKGIARLLISGCLSCAPLGRGHGCSSGHV